MPNAWICLAHPEAHGAFPQAGLDTLSAIYGALQPRNRYGCPICLSQGQPGWMRSATESEAANSGRQKQEA